MATVSPINPTALAITATNTAQPTTSEGEEQPEDAHLLADDFERQLHTSYPMDRRVLEQVFKRDRMTRFTMLSMVLGQWGTTVLKFSIKDDPEEQVYYLHRETVETWEGLKIGVMEDMEIDMHAITDMFGDPILPVHWPYVNREMPYMFAPFVVEGEPILSRTKHHLRFVSPPGADLYTQLPRPRNITVGQLKGLVAELMRQMPEYAGQRKEKHEIKIDDAISNSERLADCIDLDQTITVETSDHRLTFNPASPPAKKYIAIAADWEPGYHTRRRFMPCNPGMILVEASTSLPMVRMILEDAFHRTPNSSGFVVTSLRWRCWSVEDNTFYVIQDVSTTLDAVKGTLCPILFYDDKEINVP
ncbi:hypothetical protein FN846DRAFT_904011 [Sphaerosporella brunnea]|uniref:Uncharacterized protein n=1 Tax=Sphaerosporella brunnea TaxID=1250544 RepID=A0A5J5F5D9_9PEZI|nr:hypothetical protein FN846DRAFT_904011 [Sphaerosporella brunnea]